ncbi:DUF4156 domain-containing protein [Candidatus Methylospira mobilis]|nr:DUF4156 domain-containing protein [Candidatus Methylospira mobilis]WNV05183.1 DUF4156 domain-containing protein [Candidatus Methylospira mobilis]
MIIRNRCVLLSAMLLSACSSTPLAPVAESVIKPDSVRIVPIDRAGCDYQVGCDYLGEVTGERGSSWVWWTGDAEREADARNEMKAAAAKLGADTIQVVRPRAGQAAGAEQADGIYTGIAYRCKKK